MLSQPYVVVSHYRDVLGDAQPEAAQRRQRADGAVDVGDDHPRGTTVSPDEALDCHRGQLRGVPDATDQVLAAPQAGVVEGLCIALLSPPGNVTGGYATHEADTGVPEGDQVLSGQFGVVAREQLAEAVLGRKFHPFDRSLDMHVRRLRNKLDAADNFGDRVKTIRGVGYQLAVPSLSKLAGER